MKLELGVPINVCKKKNAITRAITKWCLVGDKEENENLLQPAFLLSVLFTPLSQGGETAAQTFESTRIHFNLKCLLCC